MRKGKKGWDGGVGSLYASALDFVIELLCHTILYLRLLISFTTKIQFLIPLLPFFVSFLFRHNLFIHQLFDKESLAANLDDFLFTANDAVGTSGQFLELKRLSDALACLQQQQHLTDKSSSMDVRRGHAMTHDTGFKSKSTAVTSSKGSGGGEMKGKLKNPNDEYSEEKSDEGDQGNGVGEKEGGQEEGEEEGGEGEEGENPRLSEARREYPGFNLTGPDIYTSADDHCLQVNTSPMLSYLIFYNLVFSDLFFLHFDLFCADLFYFILSGLLLPHNMIFDFR